MKGFVMKRAIVLFLCLLFLPSVAISAPTAIYPGDFLGDSDDVSVTSPIVNDILNWDGSAWVNRPVFEINEITDVSVASPQADDSLLYNGTYWENVPHTFGELYYHNDAGTLDFSTTTALINVTGITNGLSSNMTLSDTNGSITVIDADTYRAEVSASMQSASAADFDFHVGVDGVDQDKCHANRRIGTGTDTGNIGMTCLLDLAAGEVATFMVNSAANETIKFESLNFNLDRIP
jgi:hypothetical protein